MHSMHTPSSIQVAQAIYDWRAWLLVAVSQQRIMDEPIGSPPYVRVYL